MRIKKKKAIHFFLAIMLLAVLVYFFSGIILTSIGELLVVDDKAVASEAVVVLSTGMEYYPRLMEAAALYREGFAGKVVVNGNRKTEVLRKLERQGFQGCCPWYEGTLRILELLGVPRKYVIHISAEDAYDTVSEAKAVGKALFKEGVSNIIITTSKFHTRRARHIWKNIYEGQFRIAMKAAREGPYSPESWWKDGRQIKWVLAEYGAWIYYFWKTIQ